jgi:hypothetical protein
LPRQPESVTYLDIELKRKERLDRRAVVLVRRLQDATLLSAKDLGDGTFTNLRLRPVSEETSDTTNLRMLNAHSPSRRKPSLASHFEPPVLFLLACLCALANLVVSVRDRALSSRGSLRCLLVDRVQELFVERVEKEAQELLSVFLMPSLTFHRVRISCAVARK